MDPKDSTLFFDRLPTVSGISDPEVTRFYLDILKSIHPVMGDTVYAVDFYERRFRYVSSGHLFLCGHSPQEVQKLGYEFYSRIVHPEDLPLLRDIHRIVYTYLHDPLRRNGLAYISFNFRIYHNKEEQMVCHKVNPLQSDHPQIVICTVSESMRKEPGNLTAFYKKRLFRMDYSFQKQEWEKQPVITLSPQEKMILKLGKQGKSIKEIAGYMNIKEQSARNLAHGLYRKLDVNSMFQAVSFARNHHLDLS